MKSNHVVVAVLCAAACAASTSVASADPAQQGSQAQQDPSKDTSAPAKKSDAAPKAKTKAKATVKKAEETKADATSDAAKNAKPEDTSVVGKTKSAVEDIGKKADTAAVSAQTSVVGAEQQSDNERKARDPRLRPKDDKEARKAAESVGRTTTTAAEVVATAVQDTTRATDKPGSYDPFSLEWSPLGLIVGGRVSIQGVWVPVTHHGIILSPHFVHTSSDVAVTPDTKQSQTFTGVGAELGYRYYTGHRGPNGFFIGPSLIGGVYNASLLGSEQVFSNIGIAVDVGVQTIIGEHLTVGGGLGLEYLHVSHDFGDLPSGPSTIASSAVKPRFLFSGGYAF